VSEFIKKTEQVSRDDAAISIHRMELAEAGKAALSTKSKSADDAKSIEAFMDATDFFYEEGRPIDGNRFFANVEDLKAMKEKCWDDCGIVKVKIEFIEWEHKSK